MAIAIAATRQILADAYKGVGTYIGATTGNPGTGSTPANEATGGTPAYARVATTWSSTGSGVVTGTSVTLNVPTGTFSYIILCNNASGTGLADWSDTTDVTMSIQGTLVVTPLYTQT